MNRPNWISSTERKTKNIFHIISIIVLGPPFRLWTQVNLINVWYTSWTSPFPIPKQLSLAIIGYCIEKSMSRMFTKAGIVGVWAVLLTNCHGWKPSCEGAVQSAGWWMRPELWVCLGEDRTARGWGGHARLTWVCRHRVVCHKLISLNLVGKSRTVYNFHPEFGNEYVNKLRVNRLGVILYCLVKRGGMFLHQTMLNHVFTYSLDCSF